MIHYFPFCEYTYKCFKISLLKMLNTSKIVHSTKEVSRLYVLSLGINEL